MVVLVVAVAESVSQREKCRQAAPLGVSGGESTLDEGVGRKLQTSQTDGSQSNHTGTGMDGMLDLFGVCGSINHRQVGRRVVWLISIEAARILCVCQRAACYVVRVVLWVWLLTWNFGCCFLSACTKCSISARVNSLTLSSPARGAISFLKTGPICAQAKGIFAHTTAAQRRAQSSSRQQHQHDSYRYRHTAPRQ